MMKKIPCTYSDKYWDGGTCLVKSPIKVSEKLHFYGIHDYGLFVQGILYENLELTHIG